MPRHIPSSRRVSRTRTLAVTVVAVLAVAGCSHGSDQGQLTSGATAGPSAVESSGAATGASATPTATSGTSKPGQTTVPSAAKVTHVTLSADGSGPSSLQCAHNYYFIGTISVSRGPVTVTYAWTSGNAKYTKTSSVHFGPGGAQHATVHWYTVVLAPSFDTPAQGWMKLSVIGPNAMATPTANVVFDCTPFTSDLEVNVAAGPGACGGHVTTMSFDTLGLINVPLPYTVEWGDGTHETGTTTRTPSQRLSILNFHHTYASGTYTIHIWVGPPGDSDLGGDSRRFTLTCS